MIKIFMDLNREWSNSHPWRKLLLTLFISLCFFSSNSHLDSFSHLRQSKNGRNISRNLVCSGCETVAQLIIYGLESSKTEILNAKKLEQISNTGIEQFIIDLLNAVCENDRLSKYKRKRKWYGEKYFELDKIPNYDPNLNTDHVLKDMCQEFISWSNKKIFVKFLKNFVDTNFVDEKFSKNFKNWTCEQTLKVCSYKGNMGQRMSVMLEDIIWSDFNFIISRCPLCIILISIHILFLRWLCFIIFSQKKWNHDKINNDDDDDNDDDDECTDHLNPNLVKKNN